jgi:hypothetical protein
MALAFYPRTLTCEVGTHAPLWPQPQGLLQSGNIEVRFFKAFADLAASRRFLPLVEYV